MNELQLCVVELTNRCNLRCPHCASTSGQCREGELTRIEWQRVFGELKQLGCRILSILGGEFLLHPDWYGICSDAKAYGFELQLITNGLLVNDSVIEQFKSLDPQTVCVSFDGATAETYLAQRGIDAFDKCLALLHRLHREGFRQVNAITTFTSLNIYDFDKFAALFMDTGIVWQVQMVHRAGQRFDDSLLLTPEQYAFFVDKVTDYLYNHNDRLRLMTMDDFGYFSMNPQREFTHQFWHGCHAGREVLGLRSNGDVLGCLSLGDDFVEANLRNESLIDIWNSDRYFRTFRHKEKLLDGHCAKCPFAQKCLGGCTALALSQKGGIGDNSYCVRRLEEKRFLNELFSGN